MNVPVIMCGDVIEQIQKLDTESIDCIITSPPYWGQRDYENSSQWGNESCVNNYIEKMILWANECKRVLKNEGTLFLNIGDKYDKRKSLMMLPERLCLKMTENGWCLRNKIVWYKPNHQPSGVQDRLTNTWEPIYFFSKDSGKYYNYKYYHNIDAIRIEHKTKNPSKDHNFPEILTKDAFISQNYQSKIEEYNNEKNYKGKYVNQNINIGGSAGGRKSSKGLSYSLQRVAEITPKLKLEIIKYLKGYYKSWKAKKTGQTIDEILGYKDKAGHWFREDRGGSLPTPEDWPKLKEILKFDNTYDNLMYETHYVLQTVKNNPKGKNPGDLWDITLQHSKVTHFAQFPIELPDTIIKAFCPSDGTVLDTFAGSGTTGLAAMKNNIKSVMIDVNP
jgi:DNA modification methylase